MTKRGESMVSELETLCSIARGAGVRIMEIYSGQFETEMKADKSPLTTADKVSHRIIEEGLQKHFPGIPILSEEGKSIPYATRKNWERFWLVDPLDGTKEFINRNGEFTVNIALVEGQRPVFGVVYVPALDKLYFGSKGAGAWRQESKGAPEPISVRQPDPVGGEVVVMSRSHPSAELDQYLKTVQVAGVFSVGSSLKFCAVAEGTADLYPRLGPTMEWDTAAGQAVVEAAGGHLRTLTGGLLLYNKKSLLNEFFIVQGRRQEFSD